jgi:hypothetical protein
MQSFQKLQNSLTQYLSNDVRPECESAKNKERKEEEEVKRDMYEQFQSNR